MQQLTDLMFLAALALSAWVNLKQHHEIVQAYEDTYACQYQTNWGLYFLDQRLRELEGRAYYDRPCGP